MKNVANWVTVMRMITCVVLLFLNATSLLFMCLYLFTGATDVVDGIVARKLNIESEFGSKLDTVADLAFFVVIVVKFLDFLNLKLWHYVLLLIIVLIKLSSFVIYNKKHSGFVVDNHSVYNKITGIFLFVLPISVNLSIQNYLLCVIFALAMVASVDELKKCIK